MGKLGVAEFVSPAGVIDDLGGASRTSKHGDWSDALLLGRAVPAERTLANASIDVLDSMMFDEDGGAATPFVFLHGTPT